MRRGQLRNATSCSRTDATRTAAERYVFLVDRRLSEGAAPIRKPPGHSASPSTGTAPLEGTAPSGYAIRPGGGRGGQQQWQLPEEA